MSFRKEKKIKLSISERILMEGSLIKEGMIQLFPPRKVCSCYFDTIDFQTFYDSDEGILPRKKFRIRWYNNDLSFSKEIKISSIEGRFKTIQKFEDKKFSESYEASFIDNQYGFIYPSIIVTYNRTYYKLDSYRITFDSYIKYLDLRSSFRRQSLDPENVMEIKTGIEISDDKIESRFCYTNSRFSKYSRGIQFLDKPLKLSKQFRL